MDYDEYETARYLQQARSDLSGPFFERMNAMIENHGDHRKFDFRATQPSDTFIADGRRMSVPAFGNYIAGYSGIYAGGRLGLSGVLIAGLYYDGVDAIMGAGDFDFDADSLPNIYRGAFRAKEELHGKLSPISVDDNGVCP